MPVAEMPKKEVSRHAHCLPLGCLLLLILLLAVGLPRDAITPAFDRLSPPSRLLPFGADAMGRDLLARVAHGTLNTSIMALMVSLASLAIGLITGLFPRLFTGPVEVTNALPAVIAGMVVAAVAGPAGPGAAIAVLMVSWPSLAAHTAALATEIKAQPAVRLLPLLGVGPVRQTLFCVVPALIGPLFRHAMLRLPGIALALASLGFLGLGAPPPAPEWGRLLAEGMPYIERGWWCVLAPSCALITLSVLAVSAASLLQRR